MNSSISMEYKLQKEMAPLAWAATLNFKMSHMVIHHGSQVETCASFFVEGSWNGDFSAGELHRAEVFWGSGGVIEKESVIFVSSMATTECLYHSLEAGQLTVSNSLPLILALKEDFLGPWPAYYKKNYLSIMKGFKEYENEILTEKGRIYRTIYKNMVVTGDQIEFREKPEAPPFPNFTTYRNHLADNIQGFINNARDSNRRLPMKIYTTQSRGYDSTAINALAVGLGIDRAFTCPSSKETDQWARAEDGGNQDDDGTEICQLLGITPQRINRLAICEDSTDEIYLHAGFPDNEDANLIEVARHTTGPAMLLTGTLGEIWYPHDHPDRETIDDELKRWDPSTHGLSEFRLKHGLVHAPVPFIGACRRADIFAITNSNEMDPWRVGGLYDRPIPRRIAEERGVPRKVFGMKKMASIVNLPRPTLPQNKTTRNEFFSFLKKQGLSNTLELAAIPLAHRINRMLFYTTPLTADLIYKYRKLGKLLLRRTIEPPRMLGKLDGALFLFSVNKLRNQYSKLFREL